MVRIALIVAFAGCSSGSSETFLVATTFTVSDLSGQGPSHLDVLANQTVAIQIRFDTPAISHEPVGGCPTTSSLQTKATTGASGSAAAMTRAEILDYLPDWIVRLSLCDVASQSSVQLSADLASTSFAIGCVPVPATADLRDGDGNPVLTAFKVSGCTLSLVDAETNRVVGAHDFSMTLAN